MERLCLASNRLTAAGVKEVVEAVTSHPTLLLLDFGFTKATTTLGEVQNNNIISNLFLLLMGIDRLEI